MADFVKNTLPQFQTGTPLAFTAKAQLGLDSEMETEHSLFLDTDGVATSVSAEGIKDRLEAEEVEASTIDTETQTSRPQPTSQYLSPHPEWKGVAGNAPSPSLRRSINHSEVGQLVANWHSGPANETHVYRLPNPPVEV